MEVLAKGELYGLLLKSQTVRRMGCHPPYLVQLAAPAKIFDSYNTVTIFVEKREPID